MAIHGSLLTMPLADLLQWVKTTGRSGTLTIRRNGNEWELDFQGGRLSAYAGPEVRENLGYIVVTSGLLDEEALRDAYRQERNLGVALQRVLLNEGLVTMEQLTTCLRELVIESIYDLFIELPGEFIFSESSVDALNLEDMEENARLPLSLDVNMLVIEGARRHDEWERVRERFPHDDVPIRLVEGSVPDVNTLGLRERRILTGIRSGHNVSDICFEMRTPIQAVQRILLQLEEQGIVEIMEGYDPAEVNKANRMQKLLAQAALLRQAAQYDEAIVLLQVAVRMRPDELASREALREALEEQIKDLYNQFPPVKVPVVVADAERLSRLRLRSEERFLLDRLAAKMDIGSLIMVSSLSERDTLKALKKFLHSGIIEIR